jgi:hypothetical protein
MSSAKENQDNHQVRTDETGTAAERPAKAAGGAPRGARVPSSKGKSARKTPRRKRGASRPQKATPEAQPGIKTDQVIALLEKPQGASLAELMKATGWQAHSVRGFLSGTLGKKKGLPVRSSKLEDGVRVYAITR